MKLMGRGRSENLRVDGEDLRRLAILVLTCALCALLVIDYSSVPVEDLEVGDVAERTVVAPFAFHYQDFAERERRQQAARDASPWVYVYRADLAGVLQEHVSRAFTEGRQALSTLPSPPRRSPTDGGAGTDASPVEGKPGLEDDDAGDAASAPPPVVIPQSVVEGFRTSLATHVPDEVVESLAQAGFPREAERLAVEVLGKAMSGPIVADKQILPPSRYTMLIIEVSGESQVERIVEDRAAIVTPATARERIALALMESGVGPMPWVDAAAALARASVRPNLDYDHLETEARREREAASVPVAAVTVKRGTTLFRAGDPLTEEDVVRYEALRSSRGERTIAFQALSVGFFLFLLLASLYHFGSSYLEGFSTRARDVAAVGSLLFLSTLLARITADVSPSLAMLLGGGAEPQSIWFVVPIAGAAMLVRLLVGVAWTVLFAVAAAVHCGLVMDLETFYVVFFLLSAIAAAGAVEQTRERLALLRAGVYTGLINAATVLLIHFLEVFVSQGEVSFAGAMKPFWSVGFALLGGIASSFLVLGLIPVFEGVGFVTDYRMLELANLNHPLLRQLMLRAPGSYHHSVIVGSLAEAACQAVGANALQARVSAYFHDIGKTVKPQYFIENQRGGPNKHQTMNPFASAKIVLDHVDDGARLAREHRLPKPIIDNIEMHHGTGLLQLFYTEAVTEAGGEQSVDQARFRYRGPKPSTREAGILLLADKVEAATRTIKNPTEESIREMISAIISSVVADGQLAECPLTFKEIYEVADTFVSVLMGIYHQRIEYPETAEISRSEPKLKVPPVLAGSVITLDVPKRPGVLVARTGTDDEAQGPGPEEGQAQFEDEDTDYEAVKNLPKGGPKGE